MVPEGDSRASWKGLQWCRIGVSVTATVWVEVPSWFLCIPNSAIWQLLRCFSTKASCKAVCTAAFWKEFISHGPFTGGCRASGWEYPPMYWRCSFLCALWCVSYFLILFDLEFCRGNAIKDTALLPLHITHLCCSPVPWYNTDRAQQYKSLLYTKSIQIGYNRMDGHSFSSYMNLRFSSSCTDNTGWQILWLAMSQSYVLSAVCFLWKSPFPDKLINRCNYRDIHAALWNQLFVGKEMCFWSC